MALLAIGFSLGAGQATAVPPAGLPAAPGPVATPDAPTGIDDAVPVSPLPGPVLPAVGPQLPDELDLLRQQLPGPLSQALDQADDVVKLTSGGGGTPKPLKRLSDGDPKAPQAPLEVDAAPEATPEAVPVPTPSETSPGGAKSLALPSDEDSTVNGPVIDDHAPGDAPAAPAEELAASSNRRATHPFPLATPIIATAVLAAAGALAGIHKRGPIALLWRRLLDWTAARVVWLARIERRLLLDQPTRRRLVALLEREPGLTKPELMARLGVSRSSLRHHLRALERNRRIVASGGFRNRRYFALLAGWTSQDRQALALLRAGTAARLAHAVLQHPGASQRALCAATGILPPQASRRLAALAAHGLVRVQREGRVTRYEAGEALLRLLPNVQPPTLPVAIDAARPGPRAATVSSHG